MNATPENAGASELLCTKCNSDNTQNIALLISSGTTIVESETSSSGVGISMTGRVGFGSSTNHTSGVIVSHLAAKFKEPTSFSNQLQVFSSGFGAVVGLIAGFKFLSFWIGLGVFFAVVLGLNFVFGIIFKSVIRNSEEKLSTWKKWSDTGYFCHRCGHAFIPGSNETYVFETEDE